MTHSVSSDPVLAALESSFNGETVLAAVSGGPDSMALFNALCMLAARQERILVAAAHFDHGLRPDSHRDIRAVERLAIRYGVRVITERTDVAAHARETRQSIESAARELRYAFLERAADMAGADVIATAHTRDDQHETVVMRLMRGAGDRGLRGIHARRGRIVRPLLTVTHANTLQHCRDHHVPYVLDPSNEDRRFFRNRVRAHVIPALRGVYSNLDEVLDEISKSAHGRFEQARGASLGRISAMRHEGPWWCLPLHAFDGLDRSASVLLLMRVFYVAGTGDNVTEVHYSALLKLITDGPTGKSLDLPEIRVRRDHDALVFLRRDTEPELMETTSLAVPGSARVGDWIFDADVVSGEDAMREIEKVRGRVPHTSNELVALLATGGPFTVRFPRPGDMIRPFGMAGRKKLSDVFIDRKVPHRLRWQIPVIECGDEIVWVAGVVTSESTRCRFDAERAVRIRARRGQV